MSLSASAFDVSSVRGLTWLSSGQSVLGGDVLELAQRLDRLFTTWAARWDAEEMHFPATIPAAELQKVDYFGSFPHLVAFPACLGDDEAGLRAFAARPLAESGSVCLPAVAPVRDVLTPAACYHLYAHLQGRSLPDRRVVTLRATCFRREKAYVPLQRQWTFSMREVVCLGTAAEVETFLAAWRRRLQAFADAMSLPVTFDAATDPFFAPAASGAWLAQVVEPSKTEMRLEGLALGSLNDHRRRFGEAFGITRDGAPVRSACVAFGLERWVHAALLRAQAEHREPLEWMEEAESHD